jgi:simple sugar transport system substrate-binding protein
MKRLNFPPRVCNSSYRISRREALRRAARAGALISLSPLAGFSVSNAETAGEALGKFPNHPQWKFKFVSHVTTNPFWVPLRYGAEDACALLGTTFQWTGSEKAIPSEMVNAFDTAVSSKADGIAVALVDPTAFNDPVERALAAGIPVVSFNADARENKRLCYIGQDLFLSGKALGQRIVQAVEEGEVAGFIATPPAN